MASVSECVVSGFRASRTPGLCWRLETVIDPHRLQQWSLE